MATLKQRLHRKNASGTYDTVYFETSGDLIIGTVPIAHGGTGATSASEARKALGAAASSHSHSTSQISGLYNYILSVTGGGSSSGNVRKITNIPTSYPGVDVTGLSSYDIAICIAFDANGTHHRGDIFSAISGQRLDASSTSMNSSYRFVGDWTGGSSITGLYRPNGSCNSIYFIFF